jgi:RNA-directed DNA polymerase
VRSRHFGMTSISCPSRSNKAWQDSKTIVERLNRMMIGWANYFCLGSVSKAYSAIDMHRPQKAASVVMQQTQRAAAGI